jgi:serine/threonine protein kinase
MGEVYEVDHTRAGTRRAVKVLGRQVPVSSAAATRLRLEGEALLRFDHPNVVRVYEVGVLGDGRPFFAMELLDGETLREVLARRQVLSCEEAVDVVLQALKGLDAAHRCGMIHRDVKPGNLFVQRDGRVKLLDFGIAKFRGAGVSAVRTEMGVMLGTRKYMAPEQMVGGPIGPQADVFALGVVLFELLTGLHPRDAQAASTGTSLRWFDAPLPSLRQWVPQTPASLDQILSRAMLVDVGARFPDARAFADALCVHVPRHRQACPICTKEQAHATPVSLSFTRGDAAFPGQCSQHRAVGMSWDRGSGLISRVYAFGLALSLGAVVLAGLAMWTLRESVHKWSSAGNDTCSPGRAAGSGNALVPDLSRNIGGESSAR